MASIAQFIAGFAFFMVGLKLFSTNLNQLTSFRIRKLITQFTPNNWSAGLWGIVVSVLTAGNTFLTPFIAAGFRTVNALDLRKAIHLVVWSRVGACFYIYLAGFNIKVFILFLIGMAGTSFGLSKPKRYATFMAAVFSLGLVLFGIQEIKGATKILVDYDWYQQVVGFANQHAIVALAAGSLFILASQSLFGALVVVLGLLDTRIFGTPQALLFMYGVYLGEAILKMAYLPALKGPFKKMMSLLPGFYLVAFVVGISLHLAEAYLPVPLLEGVARQWAVNDLQFLANVNFGVHLITAVLLSLSVLGLEKIMNRLGESKDGTEAIAPVEIPSGLLDDPLITMELIQKEEQRLVGYLPRYMDHVRTGRSRRDPGIQTDLHQDLERNFQTIRAVYSELLHRGSYHEQISGRLLDNIERQNVLMSLEANLYNFCNTLDAMQSGLANDPALQNKFMGFLESIDVLVLNLVDILVTRDPFYIETMKALTSDRTDLLQEIRTQYTTNLSPDLQELLVRLINLFESSVWLIRKTSEQLNREIESEQVEEEVVRV